MKNVTFKFKLFILLLVITVPVFGYFVFSAVGGTTFNLTITTPPASSAGGPTLATGLVGHWTFDGKDMYSNVADISGQGNTGYLEGQTSTTTVMGVIGQALEFDGTDDYVTIPEDDNDFDLTTAISIAAWIKPNIGSTIAIVGKSFSSYQIFVMSGGKLRFQATGLSNLDSISSLSSGLWYHVAFTYDTSIGDKWYINGVEDSSGSNSNALNTENNPVKIGARANTPADFFDGLIDDVRQYNRALSADEITHLYKLGATAKINMTIIPPPASSAGGPTLATGLVGHWTFDGKNMYNNVADISGQGNTGYLEGQTSTTTAMGIIGQALEFDGNDDVVSAGDNPIYSGLSAITVSVWFKVDSWQSGVLEYLVAKSNNASQREWRFRHNGSSNIMQWGISPDGSAETAINIADADISLGVWHNLVGVWDTASTNTIIHLDGVQKDTDTLIASNLFDGTANLAIGASSDSAANTQFSGLIDDVRIYNRALSADEITHLYKLGATAKINMTITPPPASSSGGPTLSTGLVGHWTFDGKNMYSNVADISGQGNTGYLTNFTSTTTAMGVIGQAMEFDGANDYIEFGNVANPDESYTLNIWYNPNSETDDYGALIAKSIAAGGYGHDYYIIRKSGTDDLRHGHQSSGGTYYEYDTTHDFVVGTWYMITSVYDYATGDFKLYIDANEHLNNSIGTHSRKTGSNLRVGFIDGGSPGYANATLDDVRVYNRALSQDEITRLYNIGK